MDSYRRDRLTFEVTDSGPEGGPLVVLLHGFPQDRRSWDQVRPLLNANGLRTIAPDQRGYSPAASPAGRGNYRVSELARDVIALLDAAGAERAHVVGHDWGGAVAWALADRYPDRLASVTVCSTPHPKALIWAGRHGDQARRSYYMALFQVPFLPEQVMARLIPRMFAKTGLSAPLAAPYVARFGTPSTLTGPINWYRALTSRRPRRTGRSLDALTGARPKHNVPTTLIWGSNDFALGRAAAERTAEYAGDDYTFVELEAGHWLPETHPGAVAAEVLRRGVEQFGNPLGS